MTGEPNSTLVYEEENFTNHDNFAVTPPDYGSTIEGPGSLDNLLIIADQNTIGIRVESSETTLIDESFTKLEQWNDELTHVTAYTTPGGEKVINITDFPFKRWVRAEVKVINTTTFDWVRAVYVLGDEVDY